MISYFAGHTTQIFHHEEHEAQEEFGPNTFFHGLHALHDDYDHKTKLFRPCRNNFTLKLIRNPCLTPASFI